MEASRCSLKKAELTRYGVVTSGVLTNWTWKLLKISSKQTADYILNSLYSVSKSEIWKLILRLEALGVVSGNEHW